MKLANTLAAAAALIVIGGAAGANADVLYDNGPVNGKLDAFTINYGYEVTDSFTAASGSTATGASFVTWNIPGDLLLQVDWAISNGNPYAGGTIFASGTSSVSSSSLGAASYGYDLASNEISFGGVALTGGDYWFTLKNAVAPNGDPVFWDENNGPSSAYDTGLGNLANFEVPNSTGSESFQIIGTTGGVPEPATWAMMLIGFGGLGATLRSRRRTALSLA